MNIPVAKPIISHEEVAAVSEVLLSGMIASGPKVTAFEREFAGLCRSSHAVAVSNGTTALHAALLAAGIGPGDEVIVPAFTFFATASSVSMCGAKPVFCDIDEKTFNIDPSAIGNLVTGRTKAVIGVHLFGQPFDVDAVKETCSAKNLTLIEDAAQAHGALYHGEPVGGLGDYACFSFYATKNLITGEGGMVTTNNKAAMERLRIIINHGQSEKYLHTRLGYNYRLTDIAAAIGLVQLKKLEKFNSRRRKNAQYLSSNIKHKGLITPFVADGIQHVFHQYVLRITGEFPMKRQEFMDYLKGKGVGSAIHYPIPLHQQPYYGSSEGDDPCPVATKAAAEVLSLPVHPALDGRELAYICDTINRVI